MREMAVSSEIPAALASLERRWMRYVLVLSLFGVALAAVLMFNLSLGSVRIPFEETWTIALGGDGTKDIFAPVIREIRLPRTLAGLLSGSALAVSGLMLQVFFRNPIVGPSILGLTSGATLMVALVILGGFTLGVAASPLLLSFAAFLGAMMVMLLVMLVASAVRSALTLLVVGLMIGYVASAFTEFLVAFAERERLQGFVMWTLGSFSGFRWDELRMIAIALPVMILGSFLLSKPLNGLLLGENYARSMGVNIRLSRYLIILISSGLAGVVTAFAGPVTFIGLAVPHMARLCLGTTDNRVLIPGVILLGAVVTGFSDLLARMLFSPRELPISATTALIGAPTVVILLLKRRATI